MCQVLYIYVSVQDEPESVSIDISAVKVVSNIETQTAVLPFFLGIRKEQ